MLIGARVEKEGRGKILFSNLNKRKKYSALVALLTFLFLFSGIGQASADPYSNLNNGIISFDGFYGSDFFNSEQNWSQSFLYTNQYDSSSKIALTNGSGWGVTLTQGDNCFSGQNCWGYSANVTSARSFNYAGLSSFSVASDTYTYGTIVETAAVTLGGQSVEILSSISLDRDSNYAVVTTAIRNLGESVSDLKLFVNNYDGMVYNDGAYRSTRGNVAEGSFVAITDTSQSSNAVLADALEYVHSGTNYGAILLAGSNTGTLSSILDVGCCSPQSVVYNPQTQLTQSGMDGQYAILNQLPTLSSGETFTLKWAFGGASYTTLTSSAFLTSLLAAVRNGPTDEEIAAEAARVAAEAARVAAEAARVAAAQAAQSAADAAYALKMAPKTDLGQCYLGSDKVADPTGEIRGMLDEINRKYGYLIK